MDTDTVFSQRADLYDAIYHWKDYRVESEAVHSLLVSEGVPDGGRVLDVACGTGGHLRHLRDRFRVAGCDLGKAMIERAKSELPDVDLFVADMAELEVDQPFDGLSCLFSSIGYVFPEKRLRATAAAFARALRPGGVLVIEPWFEAADFHVGKLTMHTYDSPDLKVSRRVISKLEDDIAVLDFHWLVARAGALDVEYFTERHRLWCCPRTTLLEVFARAGFDVTYRADGLMPQRGLIVGRRMPT